MATADPRTITGGAPPGLRAQHLRLLGILGMGLIFSLALLEAGGLQTPGTREHDMWLKVLGLVCVGVFVGAAIVEARQHRKRKRDDLDGVAYEQEGSDPPQPATTTDEVTQEAR